MIMIAWVVCINLSLPVSSVGGSPPTWSKVVPVRDRDTTRVDPYSAQSLHRAICGHAALFSVHSSTIFTQYDLDIRLAVSYGLRASICAGPPALPQRKQSVQPGDHQRRSL
ncbi:hypothetical protein B0H21DRAFT_454441 [Amylocystis lapponica]|nr:hypothetical protein B0H21DRAFT_454441 [Amylocystis lapponica]